MDKNLNVEFTQISKYEMDIITQLTKNSDGLVPKKWWPEIVRSEEHTSELQSH